MVRTAGEPHRIELIPDRHILSADGKDLAYVNVRVVDKEGNLCPLDDRVIRFTVTGAGEYRASANGNPTCLDMFHLPQMPLFNGQLTTIVQAGKTGGTLTLEAKAKGVQSSKISIRVE